MSDQVLIAVISTLGSIIVAYITATANAKKADNKEDASEIERLKQENARLRSRIDKNRKGQK
ncbi:hypothetical protein QFF56_03065 [Ligilactobacillus animalis]|uniref:Uncharacterized protein n=1 Tax=Ligilactobacillus animalis TaxID=1605 RepID=A0AAJ6FWN8_9LACO|nr:hypothetical protein [Ligilactobacillus animalis]WHQ80680.1 hypothetical protein QFF56_03065 [Ligilactobacillus animalis]